MSARTDLKSGVTRGELTAHPTAMEGGHDDRCLHPGGGHIRGTRGEKIERCGHAVAWRGECSRRGARVRFCLAPALVQLLQSVDEMRYVYMLVGMWYLA